MIGISDTVPEDKLDEAKVWVEKMISAAGDIKTKAESIKEKLENKENLEEGRVDICEEFCELDQAYTRFKASRKELDNLTDSVGMQ